MLSDPDNPHYLYDLLGVLKTGFLPGIFIQPDEKECISAVHGISFLRIIESLLLSFLVNTRTSFVFVFSNLHVGNTSAEQELLYSENDI
jgi:hypothetical protein